MFLWLYYRKWLKDVNTIASPINETFKIKLTTKNFIDACIYYIGDYEPYLKMQFKKIIKSGDIILDVGANIGFHTLYFAELTGNKGKVYAFEPIPVNFKALTNNIQLNNFPQIVSVNKALGNTNTFMDIHIDNQDQNPGTFSILDIGLKNTTIECVKGDDYLKQQGVNKVDFIKVDVEGFELEVFKGLARTITQFSPIIIFEYDANYQSEINENPKELFHFLSNFGYQFFAIDGYGNEKSVSILEDFTASEILALPAIKN